MLLPLGLLLCIISMLFIILRSWVDFGYKADGIFVGINTLGCILMIIEIFMLHP